MAAYQCDRDGRTFSCKACGQGMMSSPRYDGPYPFCARKRCIKARAKKAVEGAVKDMEQGGPAIKPKPLPEPELFGREY